METEKTQEKADMMTVYEVSYLLLPSLAQEQVPAEVSAIKEAISSVGGSVISLEDPILIDLAYPMVKVLQTSRQKATSGYFGWIKFEVSKDGVEAIKKALDNGTNILRYLIIKTVRENTLLNGKMKIQKEERARKEDEMGEDVPAEVKEDAGDEEVDKSIDDLVIA